jgi:hypothetical protein
LGLGIVIAALVLGSGTRPESSPAGGAQNGPGRLAFSTYFGDTFETHGTSVAVDRDGAVYITGRSRSSRLPWAGGLQRVRAAQPRYGGGRNDAFVAKLTADGQQIVYSTFLGGSEVDFGNRIVVDASGSAYVAGTTYSSNFPTTRNAVQRRYGGGDRDCFVARFAPDGRLVYSTLIGGRQTDRCTAIAVDGDGNAYVTGSTNSPEVARTRFASGRSGSDTDVLFAKLDPTASKLQRVTRFGGSGDESGTSLALAGDGTVYVAGGADSADFPVTGGAQKKSGGRRDGFIVRLDSASHLVGGTFLGGSGADGISAIALDPAGAVVVAGTTDALDHPTESAFRRRLTSNDFPVRNALQPKWTAFLHSAFVAKLSPSLGEVRYATYLGGTLYDSAADLAVDPAGHAYVVGTSHSKDMALVDPVQQAVATASRANSDIFVAAISADGSTLTFATYLGGRADDSGSGIALDQGGNVLVIGSAGWWSRDYGPTDDFPRVRALQQDRATLPLAVLLKISRGQ